MKLLWRMVILSFFFGKFWQKRVLLWWAGGFAWVWPEGGIFQKYACFFLKVYVHFLFFVEKRMRFLLLFFDVLFFGFTRVSFKKQQKKLNPHSKVNITKIILFESEMYSISPETRWRYCCQVVNISRFVKSVFWETKRSIMSKTPWQALKFGRQSRTSLK